MTVERDKADMTAKACDLQRCFGIATAFVHGVAPAGQKRIVPRIDNQRRNPDVFDPGSGTAFSPVILSVCESVYGSGVSIIELPESFDAMIAVIVQCFRVKVLF